jgi:hypothetical protein
MSAPKLAVVLSNRGGEMDRAVFALDEGGDDPEEAQNLAIHDVIEDWILAPGDVITIEEVQ